MNHKLKNIVINISIASFYKGYCWKHLFVLDFVFASLYLYTLRIKFYDQSLSDRFEVSFNFDFHHHQDESFPSMLSGKTKLAR